MRRRLSGQFKKRLLSMHGVGISGPAAAALTKGKGGDNKGGGSGNGGGMSLQQQHHQHGYWRRRLRRQIGELRLAVLEGRGIMHSTMSSTSGSMSIFVTVHYRDWRGTVHPLCRTPVCVCHSTRQAGVAVQQE